MSVEIIVGKIVKKSIEKSIEEATKKTVKEAQRESLKSKITDFIKQETENKVENELLDDTDENELDTSVLKGISTIADIKDTTPLNDGKSGDKMMPERYQEINDKNEAHNGIENCIDDNVDVASENHIDSINSEKPDENRLKEKLEDTVRMLEGNNFSSEIQHEGTDVKETSRAVRNKLDGCDREERVEKELQKEYPEKEGYQIVKEAYLRDKDNNFVTDPETGERRRIDFVIVKDNSVVKSVEVTSMTAPKEEQIAKEQRIRDAGGNYIKDNNGNLVEIPADVKTEIERRE